MYYEFNFGVTTLAIDNQNRNVIYMGGCSSGMVVSKSTKAGINWTHRQLTSTIGGVTFVITIHPTDSNIIFAGGWDADTETCKIFKSSDGGDNWSDVSSGFAEKYNYYIYCLAINPFSPNTIYAGCSVGIFKSTNGGLIWTKLNLGLYGVRAIVFNQETPGTIYAACEYTGFYVSTNDGQSWSPMNDGLTTKRISCLALNSVDDLLFAGTFDGGVFRCNISTEVEPIIAQPSLPMDFILMPNYPNPFNQMTTIVYDIPEDEPIRVTMKIYNIRGQLINVLVDDIKEPGRYAVPWDGRDENKSEMTSGIYFCMLKAGKHTDLIKLTLIR